MGPPARRRCNHEPASGGEDRRDPGARRSRAGGPRRALPDGGRSEAEPPERSAEPTRDGGATMSRLLVLEGIDGAGTTTQARRLAARIGAHLTREPSGGPVGRLLREALAGRHAPVDATTMALLFAA